MRDRGSQVTLGTFIATFLSCLIVLRTVRSADEGGGYSFVPNLALLVAVALAICSIAVLIFFILHVPSKIHIDSVIEDVGERLIEKVCNRFPSFIGSLREEKDPLTDDVRLPLTFRRDAGDDESDRRRPIAARQTGYIEFVDNDALMEQARKHDPVLRLQYQPATSSMSGARWSRRGRPSAATTRQRTRSGRRFRSVRAAGRCRTCAS